jgi:hypothetical protein
MSFLSYKICSTKALPFLFVIGFIQSCETFKGSSKNYVFDKLTVMDVLPNESNKNYQMVIFKKSERVFLLSVNAKKVYFNKLINSKETNLPVIIKRLSDTSQVIISVN